MTPKQAIKFWGSQVTIATRLGITRQAVDNWRRRGWIPLYHQITLNSLSSGALPVTLKRKGNGNGSAR